MNVNRAELDRMGLQSYQTGKEYAEDWIWSLREKINEIEEIGRTNGTVNTERAIRGSIIGDITGDARNPLAGAMMLAQFPPLSETNLLLIRVGYEGTWLACTGSIAEFGDRLQPKTLARYNDLFRDYQDLVTSVVSGYQKDAMVLLSDGRRLYRAIKDYPQTSPDFSADDCEYALKVLYPDWISFQ